MKHLHRSELENLTSSARVPVHRLVFPMDEVARSAQIVCFGVFEADLQSGELHKNGAKVPLQGQPFQVFAILLEHSGELVTREELRHHIWPEDTFVDFDQALNTAITKIRLALGDEADNPRFVETLPRRGYRFIGPVESETNGRGRSALPSIGSTVPPGPTPVPQTIPSGRNWKLKSATALAALALMTSAVLLSNENSYLSHTRLGTWLRQAVVGRHPEPRLAFSQRRLTANPDDIPLMGGVISPDGKYLAYTDAGGFYLRQVDSGETRLVTFAKGFDPFPESWFPDSIHLLVTWIEPHKGPSQPLENLRFGWNTA